MASSSSSSSSSSCKYDVFLSFRGEDTRRTFTSHLFYALCNKKINTFMDEDLQKGDKISPDLLNAIIQGSKISVIIFSKDYASSKWCLDELVKILECQKMNHQIVIPVFYLVHPSDVRKQTGSFGKAFGENEKKFEKVPDQVQKWRDAMTEASYLVGHESTKFRHDAELVDVIVKDVLKKLEDITVSTDFHGLVGINSRIEQVKSLLCIELSDFRIVGIWGMGGMGKTTLAKAIFKLVSSDFEGKCFIENVREKSEKGGGLEQLQREIFSCVLEKTIENGGSNIPDYTKKRLQRMKIFIVLDDVDSLEQLKYLVGGNDQFGLGSRIIITTRNQNVLNEFKVDHIYEVEKLNHNEALELFCNHAFEQNHCPQDFVMLLEKIMDYAKGNALALTVCGSFLNGRNKSSWEKVLEDLPHISKSKIYNVLKISYDGLNLEEQSIFLDIACFFNGEDKDHVMEILDDSCLAYRLNVLSDMSLITISENKTLQMHDLLQEMGRNIVRRESIKDAGKRSRLWYHEDVYRVLKNNKGTNSIEGIFLDMSKVRDLHLPSGAFAKMSNLRLLKFYMPDHFYFTDMSSQMHLPQGLDYLSDELRYLYWHGFPLRTLPMNFNPESLIKLSLPYSKIERLWKGKKEAFKLKSIDLHHSQDFTMIPDPSQTPNLESVSLLNCEKLRRIPSFIQNFDRLGILCLKGCSSLCCFPRNIHFRSPITIDLSFCVNLTEFPQISGKILELNLSGTAIEEVLPSIESLTDLEKLDLTFCEKLKAVSTNICKLKSLRDLTLNYCSMLEGFPEILEKMARLEYIRLISTPIQELPSSIENVQGLKTLILMDCSKLDSLPENLGKLKSLKFIYGKRLAISQLPSTIMNLKQLEQLSLSGSKDLVLPSLSGLSSLKILKLDDCGIRKIPEDIGHLSSLESLNLKGNNFQSLPPSVKELRKLKDLTLRNCANLQSLPDLPLYPFHLDAANCKQLRSMPKLSSGLLKLDSSVLEKLSKHHSCNKDAIRMELDFSNCLKLNHILKSFELRIQSMLIASLKQFYEKEIPVPYGVSICLPGKQIPNWFGRQIVGSSINIQQDDLCVDKNFIGFALCAVVEFEQVLQADEDFSVVSKYRFDTKAFCKTEHVDRQFVFKTIKYYSFDDDFAHYPTHIYLGFDPCSITGLLDCISFDFFVDSPYKFENAPKVKRCGVSPIYVHPIQTEPDTSTSKHLSGMFGGKSANGQLSSSITYLYYLETHKFFGCYGFKWASSIDFYYFLKQDSDDCDSIKILQDIGCLSSLRRLNLTGSSLESLPTSIKLLSQLRELILSNCNMLQSLPDLPPRLHYLKATNCKRLQSLAGLQSLAELPSHLEELVAPAAQSLRQIFSSRYFTWEFDFSNCTKLNENTKNILADLLLEIQHMVIASPKKGFLGLKEIKICLPGSEIPEWFNRQSLGSSTKMKLPEFCCNRSFVGFVLCAVISFDEVLDLGKVDDFTVNCDYGCGRDFTLKSLDAEFDNELIYDSDHLFLGFDPFLLQCVDNRVVSFGFYVSCQKRVKVKCCGVCPIYAHPILTKPNTFTVNMVPTSEEECRKLHNEFHNEASTSADVDEKIEPSPKRICREQIIASLTTILSDNEWDDYGWQLCTDLARSSTNLL